MSLASFITNVVTARITDETPITFKYENPGADYLSKLEAAITLDENGNQIVCSYREMPLGRNSYTFTYFPSDLTNLWTVLLDTGVKTRQFYLILRSTMSDGTHKVAYPITISCVNYNPEIKVELWDANDDLVADITYDNKTFIAHKSIVRFLLTVTPKKGGRITNYWIECDGKRISNQESGVFSNPIKNNVITIRCEDNRGNWYTDIVRILDGAEYQWVPYIPLDCTAKATFDANSELQVTVTGKFYNGNFKGLEQIDNSLALRYYVEDISEETGSWVNLGYLDVDDITDSDGTYHYSFTDFDYDYNKSYKLSVQLIDAVSTYTTEEIDIPAVTPLFDWSKTDFNFNVPVYIKGNAVPYVVRSSITSTYGQWSYRIWSDKTYECWMNLLLEGIEITTASSASGWYTTGERPETNLTFPERFYGIPTINVMVVSLGTSSGMGSYVFPVASNTAVSQTQTGSFQLMATSRQTTAKKYLLSYQVKGRIT